MNAPLTEVEIRALRDRVFGHASTDKNWDACREGWMKPEGVAWLQQHDFNPATTNQPRS